MRGLTSNSKGTNKSKVSPSFHFFVCTAVQKLNRKKMKSEKSVTLFSEVTQKPFAIDETPRGTVYFTFHFFLFNFCTAVQTNNDFFRLGPKGDKNVTSIWELTSNLKGIENHQCHLFIFSTSFARLCKKKKVMVFVALVLEGDESVTYLSKLTQKPFAIYTKRGKDSANFFFGLIFCTAVQNFNF